MLDHAKIMSVFLSQVIRNGFCSMRPCVIWPLTTSLTSSLSISTSFYLRQHSAPCTGQSHCYQTFSLVSSCWNALPQICALLSHHLWFRLRFIMSPSLATRSKIADTPPCFILILFALVTSLLPGLFLYIFCWFFYLLSPHHVSSMRCIFST